MQLDRLLSHLTYESVQGSQQREVTDICYHSARVEQGSLFVCLKGFRTDGHEYLPEVLKAGAQTIVIERSAAVLLGEEILLYTKNFCMRMSGVIERM